MRAVPVVQSTSSYLRAWTREEHEAVEAALDMQELRTSAELVAVLLGWVAVWNEVRLAVVEPGAAAAGTAELLIPSAQALDWLAADLADLAATAGAASPHGATPEDARMLRRFLDRASMTWGVAYVLRGSRLGGRVLAPLVRDALQLSGDGGTHFLASRGTDPGREWVSFRRRLDAVALTATELTEAVEAARWTFRWVGAAARNDGPRAVPAGRVSM